MEVSFKMGVAPTSTGEFSFPLNILNLAGRDTLTDEHDSVDVYHPIKRRIEPGQI